MIFFVPIDKSLQYYLSYDFVDLNENKIKNTQININGKYYNNTVKNKTFYLSLFNKRDNLNVYEFAFFLIIKEIIKYIPFKQILIEGITNDYIYIRTLNKAISEQLSIIDWVYPVFNDSSKHSTFMISIIWTILEKCLCFFKLHLTNENNYKILLDYISKGIIKKPRYYKIFFMEIMKKMFQIVD